MLEIAPDIGLCPEENSFCLAAVNTLLAIMANRLSSVDIYFFLTVNLKYLIL